jgi:hypothetical protein
MPYIVQNPSGVAFENNLFFGTNTINYGIQSDAANSNNVQLYTDGNTFFRTSVLHSDDFFINGPFSMYLRDINSTYTTALGIDNVITGSFSANTDIWLGTASRVEGMEIVIRRLDNNASTVTVRSSQSDILIGAFNPVTDNFTIGALQRCRLIRLGGNWYVFYQGL